MLQKSLTTTKLPGQKFLEYQLSWFGKTYLLDKDITLMEKGNDKEAFISFLESYAESGTQISIDQQEEFRSQFTDLYDAAFGRADRNKERKYGIRKMSGLLEDQNLDYEVTTESSYWIVRRCNLDTQKESE